MGTLALAGGYLAVSVRNGELLHRRAGTVFFFYHGRHVDQRYLACLGKGTARFNRLRSIGTLSGGYILDDRSPGGKPNMLV